MYRCTRYCPPACSLGGNKAPMQKTETLCFRRFAQRAAFHSPLRSSSLIICARPQRKQGCGSRTDNGSGFTTLATQQLAGEQGENRTENRSGNSASRESPD